MKKLNLILILGMILLISGLVVADVLTNTLTRYEELGERRLSENVYLVKVKLTDGTIRSYAYNGTTQDREKRRLEFEDKYQKENNIFREDILEEYPSPIIIDRREIRT